SWWNSVYIQLLVPSSQQNKKTVVHYEPSLISVRSGSSVTLQCRLDQRTSYCAKSWYMQKLGQEPKELVIRLANKTEPIYSTGSNRLNMNGNFLTIKKASKEDEGIYFCGGTKTNNVVFSSGMFLTVTGNQITVFIFIFCKI
uniref:Ig-like domain-containing protein n=1 Tax=Astyanax mexicanus TaxID=7994 RepID=A0A3B1JUM4_ASTMX